ncbi:pentatricopeptide repeat-containing protein At2g33680-like [Magnolia sinica]|uniref:pentatricopeptide repeat-containing protein At2g33680-like n=1 Tax=Magnolia sinica TaxID=86752 RepID=UPI002658E890|nr:pentatricopeptide repeat-containing protein At2g33680-like [Magnolia sinica]
MRSYTQSYPKLMLAATSVQTVRFATSFSFKNSNSHGLSPTFVLEKNYANLLRICAETSAISEGKSIHSRMLKTIPEPPLFLANSLANMYCKCGYVQDAHCVFDEMSQPDVISWNTMIAGYFLSGFSLLAFGCFRKMLSCGVIPDRFSFSSVLKGCISLGYFDQGLQAHCTLMKFGLSNDVFAGSGLVEFYANFHFFDEAKKVFDCLVVKDTVLINIMIGICTKNGNLKEAFVNFQLILSSSLVPTRATFVNFLGAIHGYEVLKQGLQVHCLVIKFGFESDGVVENSLVGMYSSCDSMDDAFNLLVHSGSKNVMSWTTLITGYAGHGFFQDAMDVFYWFYHESVVMDDVLLACILCVSAAAECLDLGMQIHSVAYKSGFEMNSCIRDALMDLYAKCSCMEDTMQIFQLIMGHHDVFSWTTVISGYVHNGLSTEALMSFYQMQKDGVNPDSVACISVLTGCVDLSAIDQGEQIHAYVIKFGCKSDISIQTALLSLYAEGGRLDSVLKLFGKVVRHDVISWTALISVYAKVGYNEAALAFLIKMLQEGIKPNNFTLASALTACANLTATETGKLLHTHIIKIGFEDDKFVGSALIDMYSKCASMENAVTYFEGMAKSDVVLWNALLSGYAHHGNGLEVLKALDELRNQGVRPDHITFLAVLSACSHSGLANRAVEYFISMRDEHGITPMKEHYACVVDALGRAGFFKESVEFIDGMGIEPGVVVLRTLLSSCTIHGCIPLGLAVVAKMMVFGDNNIATYVLLSNLYAIDGRWDDSKKVREVMERKCSTRKEAGKSWIESRSHMLGSLF